MNAQLALDAEPHRLLLGDLAGLTGSSSRQTSIAEFVAGLPSDVLCAGGAFGVHDYGLGAPRVAISQLERALDARGRCGSLHIWITETGARVPGTRRAPPGLLGCRELAAALATWNADPRIDAAFEYAFREDATGGYGLADPSLARVFPSYPVWRAWGARGPQDPAPTPRC
jgi:hypothetical protein